MKNFHLAILVACMATLCGLTAQAQGSNCNYDLSPNACWGYEAIPNPGTSANDSAFGDWTLYSITSGSWDTATGGDALYSNTSGSYNTATGGNALYSNTTSSWNTATGYNSRVANHSCHATNPTYPW